MLPRGLGREHHVSRGTLVLDFVKQGYVDPVGVSRHACTYMMGCVMWLLRWLGRGTADAVVIGNQVGLRASTCTSSTAVFICLVSVLGVPWPRFTYPSKRAVF